MILREFVAVAVSNIGVRLATLAVIPLLHASYGLESTGQFDAFWSFMLLAELIFGFKIADSLFRIYFKSEDGRQVYIESVRMILLFLTVLILSGIAAIYWFGPVSLYFSLLVAVRILVFLNQEYLRALQRFSSYRSTNLLMGLMNFLIVFILTLALNEFEIEYFILGFLSVNTIVFIYSCRLLDVTDLFKSGSGRWHKLTFFKILSFSARLFPSAISWWVMRLANRTIVLAFMGSASAGLLSVSMYPFVVMTAISTYMILAFQRPIFSFSEGDVEKRSLFFEYNRLISFLLFLVLLVVSTFLWRGNYFIFADVDIGLVYLTLVACMYLNFAAFYGIFYSAENLVGRASINSMLSSFLNVILLVSLIEVLGVTAVGVSMVISSVFFFGLRLSDSSISKNNRNYLREFVFLLLLATICMSFYNSSKIGFFGTIIISIVFFAYKPELRVSAMRFMRNLG